MGMVLACVKELYGILYWRRVWRPKHVLSAAEYRREVQTVYSRNIMSVNK